jgi:hypothetical protein
MIQLRLRLHHPPDLRDQDRFDHLGQPDGFSNGNTNFDTEAFSDGVTKSVTDSDADTNADCIENADRLSSAEAFTFSALGFISSRA